MNIDADLSYEEIPGFQNPTAIGHRGRLLIGTLGNVPVAAMQGRFHCYEGHRRRQIVFPIEVLAELGVQTLLLSCAAGGLNHSFREGDLMLIEDHVDFLPSEQTIRPFHHRAENSRVYDQALNEFTVEMARKQGISLRQGTYVAVPGPNYETRAEIRFFGKFADAIGMSTVPEATKARELGLRVTGLAAITNLCRPDSTTVADGEHVIEAAHAIAPKFRSLVAELIRQHHAGR